MVVRKKLSQMSEEELSELTGTTVEKVDKETGEIMDISSMDLVESSPRLVIIGEVDGYQVHINVSGLDLLSVADGDDVIPMEPGIIHATIASLKEQGIKPYWPRDREKASSSSSTRRSTTSKSKGGNKDWECPVHGAEHVNTNYFAAQRGVTEYECQYKEEAWDEDEDDFTKRPKWGKINTKTGDPFKTKGTYYWYCKHTEKDDE